MKTSRFVVLLIAMLAVATVLVVVLEMGLLLPGSSTKSGPRTTFALPLELSTAAVNASNPHGCGTNSSDYLSFPARSMVYYHVSVNSSGDQVNYWTFGEGPPSSDATVQYGNASEGEFTIGAAGSTLQFVFQGCGPTSPDLVGFWGNYTLPAAG